MNDLKTELTENEQIILQRIVQQFNYKQRRVATLDYLDQEEITNLEKPLQTALDQLVKRGYLHQCQSIDDLVSLTPIGFNWIKNNKLIEMS